MNSGKRSYVGIGIALDRPEERFIIVISLRAGWHTMFSDLFRLLLYLGEASLSPERKLIIRNQLFFRSLPLTHQAERDLYRRKHPCRDGIIDALILLLRQSRNAVKQRRI